MAKTRRRIKAVYLVAGIVLLVAALSTAYYFFFIKNNSKDHTRGTYVFHHYSQTGVS